MYYFMIGFIFLIILIIRIFKNNSLDKLLKFIFFLIILGFIVQTLGLAARWVISGHAPWSNGYESMIYISWATMLSGIIFSLRSKLTLDATTLVTSLFFQQLNNQYFLFHSY